MQFANGKQTFRCWCAFSRKSSPSACANRSKRFLPKRWRRSLAIERAVILTRGVALEVPVNEMKAVEKAKHTGDLSLAANEGEHILRVLGETDWVVVGASGAAARLGMNRTTLQSRIRKLGIARPK